STYQQEYASYPRLLWPCLKTILSILTGRIDYSLLFPDGVGIELRGRLAALDVLVEDRGDVGFGDLGIPGIVRVNDHRRSLFARTKAGGTADQHFAWHHAALHQTHIERHQ